MISREFVVDNLLKRSIIKDAGMWGKLLAAVPAIGAASAWGSDIFRRKSRESELGNLKNYMTTDLGIPEAKVTGLTFDDIMKKKQGIEFGEYMKNLTAPLFPAKGGWAERSMYNPDEVLSRGIRDKPQLLDRFPNLRKFRTKK